MQMVGATKGFIRVPFIWKSVQLGIFGAFVAIAGLIAFAYYIDQTIPELDMFANYEMLGLLFAVIVGLGILITWISTFFATQRFLNLRTEELYY